MVSGPELAHPARRNPKRRIFGPVIGITDGPGTPRDHRKPKVRKETRNWSGNPNPRGTRGHALMLQISYTPSYSQTPPVRTRKFHVNSAHRNVPGNVRNFRVRTGSPREQARERHVDGPHLPVVPCCGAVWVRETHRPNKPRGIPTRGTERGVLMKHNTEPQARVCELKDLSAN